jgi:hypothetical protein
MPKQLPSNEAPVKPNANPDQDLYDIFVSQGIRLAGAAAEKLKGKTSIDLLGNALFEIVNRIETEGEKNGIGFNIAVILHGSNEILGHLIRFSKVQINEEQIKAVIGIATGKYLENAVKTGKMSQEQVQQLARTAQQSAGGRQPAASPEASPVQQRPMGA